MADREARRLEEPFILFAMASLLAGTIWLNLRYPLLLGFYYSSELLAITHTLTLGFVTSIIMGVFHRLAPMALMVMPRSRALARLQFWCYAIGVLGMISHFALGRWNGLAWSAWMVLVAAVIQLYNWRDVFVVARRGDWVARFVATSQVYFLAAAALGVFLASAKAFPGWVRWSHGTFVTQLYAHVHLAALGWVTNMIFGFHLRLWPRTQGARDWIPLRYVFLQTGVLGMTVTWLFDTGNRIPFALLVVAAVIWQAWGPTLALVRGRARDWELVPMGVLFCVAVAGLILASGWPSESDPLRLRLQFAYGFAGLWGWFVLSITVFAFKLFPMWVWQERFQADFGRVPVPGMRQLASERLRSIANLSLSFGVAGTAFAIGGGWELLLRIALASLLLGVLAFLANFYRVARWAIMRKPFVPTQAELAEFQRFFPAARRPPFDWSG